MSELLSREHCEAVIEKWRALALAALRAEVSLCDTKTLEMLVTAAYKHGEISISRAMELLPHRNREWIMENSK